MSLDHYDAPDGSYTSVILPGMAAFRSVTAELFDFTRTEVVRDRSRCAAKSSEHCECGAVDEFTRDLEKGRFVFEVYQAAAGALGIQSVIFNRRVVGFGNPTERHYTGPDAHIDHVHCGLNRWARQNLTAKLVREALMKIVKDALREVLQEEGLVAMDDAGKLTVAAMLTESVTVDGKKVLKDGVKLIRDELKAGFDSLEATH